MKPHDLVKYTWHLYESQRPIIKTFKFCLTDMVFCHYCRLGHVRWRVTDNQCSIICTPAYHQSSPLSLCFTLSPESTPFISSSTSFWYQFLQFRLTYSFNHHFFLFWLTTLLINNSLSLSPTYFTNPTPAVSLLPPDCLHGLLPRPFLLSYSVLFSISLIMF